MQKTWNINTTSAYLFVNRKDYTKLDWCIEEADINDKMDDIEWMFLKIVDVDLLTKEVME